ncbi:Cas10/Cmr2 second palm domain-containing protein [Algoriphagus chordae]|uniref:Cas10/Cmr2 second palm domain-containing protein n=1 Tax=Algoriphagus chordae TaxID=237019 RepID=A0A2W7QJK4_9BACT|nr:hypothetical protein [Algoriphagus chordae]PZX48291.1 hypothetical protein LV85_03701 [Algoriphagus chordae]
MTKYLYGASIQGIQSFIFQTNKLKEIVGGSALVEYICTQLFKNELGSRFKEENVIISAAGNIKYQFDDKKSCELLVKTFPKIVMDLAPGITVSQAVQVLESSEDFSSAIQELENKLKTQRSKANYSMNQFSPFMICETARRTGGAAISYFKNEAIDSTQIAKQDFEKRGTNDLYFDLTGKRVKVSDQTKNISDLVDKEFEGLTSIKNWIGVIHADGNNLGKKLIKIYGSSSGNDLKIILSEFSKSLDIATKKAAKEAFDEVFDEEDTQIKIRPIVLGGDDLTVLINGSKAVPFTSAFLEAFECYTKSEFVKLNSELKKKNISFQLEEGGLTACAGIAFVKAKYPFHYGVHLAEELCAKAKKVSKKIAESENEELTPSSIMFHKVQSSFVSDFDSIVKNELTTSSGTRFDFGPYFLKPQKGYATIKDLGQWVAEINLSTAPKSNLRQWLTIVRDDETQAEYLMERILEKTKFDKGFDQQALKLNEVYTPRLIQAGGDDTEIGFTHLYDTLTLANL